MTSHKYHRSGFCHTITVINTAHPLRTARLDFLGSVTLVCVFGMIAKFIQTLLLP